MKKLLLSIFVFSLLSTEVVNAVSWYTPPYWWRQFFTNQTEEAVLSRLNIVPDGTTSVTNWLTSIEAGSVTSNEIAVGTIGTNLLSQSAYDALVGGGDGGSGDALLAGTNIWTGTNIFNEEIQGLAFTIFTNGYGAFQKGLEAPIIYASSYLNTPIVTNAENGSVVVEGVTFNDGGMSADSITSGTIDAARLPVVWTNAVAADGVEIEGVGVTNRTIRGEQFHGQFRGGWFSSSAAAAGFGPENNNPPWIKATDASATSGSASLVVSNLHARGSIVVTNALLIRSNSWTTPPTLSPGDIAFLSQEGVPVVVSKSAGGVERTNRLDGVPAGIVTNNHASAVTFSNDVTVASNLVVQGEMTLTSANVATLNATNIYGDGEGLTNLNFGSPWQNVIIVDAASGSDATGNGTLQTPFETIGVAEDYCTNGKSLYISPGSYSDPLTAGITAYADYGVTMSVALTNKTARLFGNATLYHNTGNAITLYQSTLVANANNITSPIQLLGDELLGGTNQLRLTVLDGAFERTQDTPALAPTNYVIVSAAHKLDVSTCITGNSNDFIILKAPMVRAATGAYLYGGTAIVEAGAIVKTGAWVWEALYPGALVVKAPFFDVTVLAYDAYTNYFSGTVLPSAPESCTNKGSYTIDADALQVWRSF